MDRPASSNDGQKFPGTNRPRSESSRLTSSEMARLRPYAPAWLVKPRRGVPALHRTFSFGSFAESMWFTLKVGEQAERDGQRPIILISWDRVTVALATPGTEGLHRRDFVAAAAIDRLYERRRGPGPAESTRP